MGAGHYLLDGRRLDRPETRHDRRLYWWELEARAYTGLADENGAAGHPRRPLAELLEDRMAGDA